MNLVNFKIDLHEYKMGCSNRGILYVHLVYAGYDVMEIILHFSIYWAIKHQDVYLSCIHRTELQI